MRLYRSTANSCDAYRPSVSDWTIAKYIDLYEDYRKLREGGG